MYAPVVRKYKWETLAFQTFQDVSVTALVHQHHRPAKHDGSAPTAPAPTAHRNPRHRASRRPDLDTRTNCHLWRERQFQEPLGEEGRADALVIYVRKSPLRIASILGRRSRCDHVRACFSPPSPSPAPLSSVSPTVTLEGSSPLTSSSSRTQSPRPPHLLLV